MRCFHPLKGWKSKKPGASGKRAIVFNHRDGYSDLPMEVPCGQCKGCRLERSRQWAVRCVHEASLYEHNCFVTLTLSDEHMPPGGTLDKSLFQQFIRRLRKEAYRRGMDKIRYYHCGEYGEIHGRPHYHACLFNFDFPDKIFWTRRKNHPVWRSQWLERLWPLGQSELGAVTFESAAYVARYIMKKITGPQAQGWYLDLDDATGEVTKILPEYTTMSRRPGIGKPWLDKYMSEVYPSDSVVVRGREMKPPRFYDGHYELVDAPGALEVARARRSKRRREDETPERLEVIEKVLEARLATFTRGLE